MIRSLAYLLPILYGSVIILSPGTSDASVVSSAIFFIGFFPLGYAASPRYVPKWKKQACEIPAAQHPNSHYVCDEAGEVKCLPGWTGDLCDVPLCRKGCDPLQGYCRRPGECRCKLGFYGDLCDKCVALPGCQHGRCNVSFECSCDSGWKGLFCSEPKCHPDCNPNQGYCERPGECKCRLGWQGAKCKQCAVLPGCVHGTCQGPLECRCEPGWTGFLCQTPICSHGCSRENGGCRRPGTCRCRVGYSGVNCTECVPYPGCVHGTCRRPWECRCQSGWTGDLCDEKLTFCDEHHDICQNNGTCISMTKEDGDYRCICPLGYMGRQCQIQTMEPATDLIPPLPVELPQESEISSVKPEVSTTGIQVHQNPEETISEEKATSPAPEIQEIETTVETLGPIFITDLPSTVEPAATAGKWPTESPTLAPATDSYADNEA
ncbi:delta-like protein 1 [Fopius arisanus]|uniref:Delta-like protein 1 n=1 Tax=Fopius arisanus TaxID=64838 RepID=A0A9R1TJF9_9HYME|nr:PREDICTED: delta-like protein 1 [Fopius arisanus]